MATIGVPSQSGDRGPAPGHQAAVVVSHGGRIVQPAVRTPGLTALIAGLHAYAV